MTTMTPGPAVLERARRQVEPGLRAAVDRLDPANRAISAYHLGWTDAEGNERPAGGGKAIRPAIALLAAEAAGGPSERLMGDGGPGHVGLPAAIAVELVHNFSLLHDDVMDEDRERRHRPTVWTIWGVPAAILAGDAMLALAQEVLLEAGTSGPAAAMLLNRCVAELIRGQTQDLAFETRRWVELEECKEMAAGKTGALLSASARTGAVLAGAGDDVVAALGRYGDHVGMAFQLMDDVLGIWGDPAVTGKPVLSDLRARKKTLAVSYALSHRDARSRALADWLAADGEVTDETELHSVAAMIEEAGGRSWAIAEAEREVELAAAAISSVPLAKPAADELVDLTFFLTRREA
jgi:geranylgeranyl diphosphate synthase type I